MFGAFRRATVIAVFLSIALVGISGSPSLARALASSPTAALSFDEGKGEFARDSAGNHDAAIHGAEWTEAGKYGSALQFDGENDILTIPDSNDLDFTEGFTLEAWVRPEATHPWATLFAKEDPSGELPYSFLLYAQNPGEVPSAYLTSVEAAETGVNGSAPLPLNTWTHVALTSDNEHSRLYIDGKLDETGSALPLLISNGALQIGGNEIWGEHFEGKIDEVRLYSEALGEAGIEEDESAPIGLAAAPEPTAALSFDEGKGEFARDSAGSHDGRIHGAAWAEAGKYGSALEFDGENDILTIPDSNDLDFTEGFTLEAWVRPDGPHEWDSVITKETSSGFFGYQLYAQGGGEAPVGYVAEEDAEKYTGIAGPEALPSEAWSHLALTSDGEEMRLYVDGKLAEAVPSLPAEASDGALQIGGNEVFGEHFDGRIDEVRLYGQVLGAGDIAEGRDTAIEAAPAPKPTAALSFDEGEGEVAHDSVEEHDGTIHGAEWTEEGKYGSALEFDGENDLLTIPDSDDLDFTEGFTLEAWVRPDEEHNWASVIAKEDSGEGLPFGYLLYGQGGGEAPAAYIAKDEAAYNNITGESPLPQEAWSHLALTSDGDEMRLYVDGELVDTEDSVAVKKTDGALQIGGNEVFGEHFDGRIDEVRLYDAVLGKDEIEEDRDTEIKHVAAGYTDPPLKLGLKSENLMDVAGLVAENSPRAVPSVEPSGVVDDWYTAEWDVSTSFDLPTSAELHSELDSLLADTGTWDWAAAPELTLGAGAGWVGWEVGSAIWGVFFDEDSPEGESESFLADHWYVAPPGHMVLSDLTGNAYTPAAWGLATGDTGRVTDTGACEIEIFGGGSPIYAPGWNGASFCGVSKYRNYVLWEPFEVVKCGEIRICPDIEPLLYDGLNQPEVPTAEELQDGVEVRLDGVAYPVLNRFINHELEPQNYPDPRVRKRKENHRCDRSDGAKYQNPEGNSSPEPFAKYYETPFDITVRPEGFESTSIYLHYGLTSWIPSKRPEETPWYVDSWDGWGYRHIVAKHGWSPLDKVETALALEGDLSPSEGKNGNFVYELPDLAEGLGGVACTRVVVVDFDADETDPAPRGIVTSFNKVG